MGRPPLNVTPTQIRLSEKTKERIDALIGSGSRAEFIRDAIDRELTRRERELKKAHKPLSEL